MNVPLVKPAYKAQLKPKPIPSTRKILKMIETDVLDSIMLGGIWPYYKSPQTNGFYECHPDYKPEMVR